MHLDRPDRTERPERVDSRNRDDKRPERIERIERVDSRSREDVTGSRDGRYRGRGSQGSQGSYGRSEGDWNRPAYYKMDDERYEPRDPEHDRRRNVNGEEWVDSRRETERDVGKGRVSDGRTKNFDERSNRPERDRDSFIERSSSSESWSRVSYEQEKAQSGNG